MKIISIIKVIVLFFSIDVYSQIEKDALLGKWIGISKEIYEMKKESVTLDGDPIRADIVIRFKESFVLDITENGISYKNLDYRLSKKTDGFNYLFFGNREYLILSFSKDSLVLIKSNTVLPIKTVFKKEG